MTMMRSSTSMVPQNLPGVLPTDRLLVSGMLRPEFRKKFRRIPTLRNIGSLCLLWVQSFGVLLLARWVGEPWVWVIAYFLMGRAIVLYAILMHEASHRLLFKKKSVNDFVGASLLAFPIFVPFRLYRRGHMAHHKDEMGPYEPDLLLYANYPTTKASFWRKLGRDLFFISGWKNFRLYLRSFCKRATRGTALSIFFVQGVYFFLFWLCTGYWWSYIIFWFLPWMTLWRVFNRLRAIAEHGGMQRSSDRRETTHVVRQHWISRFWIVPYKTGWHLAHHVDMGIPFRYLPQMHRELVTSGWVIPEIEYASYIGLWRTLRSRNDVVDGANKEM